MTATRSIPRRSWALLTALMLFAALVVPILAAQKAQAATPDNACQLDVQEETASNPTGVTHTLTAVIENASVGTCNDDAGDFEVDFEIESGPAARVNVTGDAGVGGTASDDGNSPTTPDLTCIANDGNNATETCTVTFTSDTAGSHVIRAWVDDDKDNTTADYDAAEGQNAGVTDAVGGSAVGAVPGNRTEPDDTDVVTKTWFTALAAAASLDCTPETATNPANGPGSTETYTCTLFNDNGAGGGTAGNGVKDGTEAGIAGVLIDGENRNGPNDPDDNNAGTSPDYNNACTTGADGSCSFDVAASEAQPGTATLCFWADSDADAQVGGENGQIDGSDCAEGQAVTDSDVTDVVAKTWIALGTAFNIELTPESDQNLKGESHTVTATVTDFADNPVVGTFVDFNIEGRNDGADPNANQVATNASGQATFTYTDVNTGTPNGEQDAITGYVDNNGDNAADNNAAGNPMTDTVLKFWFTTAPTATSVEIDMIPAGGANSCPDTAAAGAAAEKTDTNFVGQIHNLCAAAYNAGGALNGQAITFTTDTGEFIIDDGANAGVFEDDDTVLGTSVTVSADGEADADIQYSSTQTGTANITATSGDQSDTATKVWTPDSARNLDCEPDEATNPTGTTHVVSCVATDHWGNPTNDVDGDGLYGEAGTDDAVNFSETGAGRFETPAGGGNVVLAADGTVEAVLSTTDGEEGVQSITAEFFLDLGDSDVPATDVGEACDMIAGVRHASEIGGAATGRNTDDYPAGNCEETVEKTWTDEPPAGEDHARTLHLNKAKHVNLGGGKRSLKWAGNLSTDDGLAECSNGQQVKVQIRAGGSWVTRKSDTTNQNGKFAVLIRDIAKKYRAVAPRSTFTDDDGAEQVCLRAVSNVRKHRHNNKAGAKYYR